MHYIRRQLESQVLHAVKRFPAVMLTGITPLGSGGVIAVGGIAPDNRSELNQQLSIGYEAWGKSIVCIDMLVNYTDESGTPYSEKFNLTFTLFTPSVTKPTQTPTATTTPSMLYRPQLVVIDYETSAIPLQPGVQFDLKVTIQNVGNVEAKQITMIVGGGSTSTTNIDGTPAPGGIDGATGEFTTFAPLIFEC